MWFFLVTLLTEYNLLTKYLAMLPRKLNVVVLSIFTHHLLFLQFFHLFKNSKLIKYQMKRNNSIEIAFEFANSYACLLYINTNLCFWIIRFLSPLAPINNGMDETFSPFEFIAAVSLVKSRRQLRDQSVLKYLQPDPVHLHQKWRSSYRGGDIASTLIFVTFSIH